MITHAFALMLLTTIQAPERAEVLASQQEGSAAYGRPVRTSTPAPTMPRLQPSLYSAAANAGNRVATWPVAQPQPFSSFRNAFAVDLALNAAGSVAAIVTTEQGLDRCARCREGNPLVHNLEQRIVLRSARLVALGGLQYYLRRHGRKGTADVCRYLALAVDLADSVHNIRTGR